MQNSVPCPILSSKLVQLGHPRSIEPFHASSNISGIAVPEPFRLEETRDMYHLYQQDQSINECYVSVTARTVNPE